MNDQRQRGIRRICQSLLERSIGLYPPEMECWGRAALAEVQAMPSTFAVVRWTHGALWVALRAYLKRVASRPSELFLGGNSLLRHSWRSMSPVFLALSLSLFLIPQFREALHTTTSIWISGRQPGLPARSFHALEAAAEREHDARTLAFLAMRSQDKRESVRLADEAVALDPGLTWILSAATPRWPQIPARWLEELEHWDPDNAFPYVLQAGVLTLPAARSAAHVSDEILTGNPEFRKLMARAFAAARYDSYLGRRLDLDREVMRRHDIGSPLLLLVGLQEHVAPHLYTNYCAQAYANWLVADADVREREGQLQAAAERYEEVFWFGEKMDSSATESWYGPRLQKLAGDKLAAILLEQGKHEESATLKQVMLHLGPEPPFPLRIALTPAQIGPFKPSPPALSNPGLIMQTSTEIFVLALVLSAASFLSFRFRHGDGESRVLPRLLSRAPLVLFLAALVLLISYLPYAHIFETSMATSHLANYSSASQLRQFEHIMELANLQYPFLPFFQWDVSWLAIFGAPCIIFLMGIYSLVRLRLAPVSKAPPVAAS